MSIVVVEGVDGSGKTTLIRNLRARSKTYFWVASSSGRPKCLADLHDALHWIGQAAYLRTPVVCDRLPLISEAVYGPVMRGSSLLEQLQHKYQKEYGDILKGVDRIIYCRPSQLDIARNITISGIPQLNGVLETLPELLVKYDDLMNTLRDDNVKVYSYDYTRLQRVPLEELFFGQIN